MLLLLYYIYYDLLIHKIKTFYELWSPCGDGRFAAGERLQVLRVLNSLFFLLQSSRHNSVYGLPKSVWAGERLQVLRVRSILLSNF